MAESLFVAQICTMDKVEYGREMGEGPHMFGRQRVDKDQMNDPRGIRSRKVHDG